MKHLHAFYIYDLIKIIQKLLRLKTLPWRSIPAKQESSFQNIQLRYNNYCAIIIYYKNMQIKHGVV